MYQSNAQYPNKQGIELEDYAIIWVSEYGICLWLWVFVRRFKLTNDVTHTYCWQSLHCATRGSIPMRAVAGYWWRDRSLPTNHRLQLHHHRRPSLALYGTKCPHTRTDRTPSNFIDPAPHRSTTQAVPISCFRSWLIPSTHTVECQYCAKYEINDINGARFVGLRDRPRQDSRHRRRRQSMYR